MTNLLIVLAILFASLFLVVKMLDGRAKPLNPEQQSRLSRWLIILVFASIVIALLRTIL